MTVDEHLISCLGEEGVEVALELAKLCSKTNRFGPADRNVLNPTGPTNVERLVDELNDLLAVVGLLMEAGTIPHDWQNDEKQAAKRAKVRKFLGYAAQRGTISDPVAIQGHLCQWCKGVGCLTCVFSGLAENVPPSGEDIPVWCRHCGKRTVVCGCDSCRPFCVDASIACDHCGKALDADPAKTITIAIDPNHEPK